jgi:hypothetical protein
MFAESTGRTADPQEEFVEVANGGLFPVLVSGLEITDYTRTQQNVHIYRFPTYADDSAIELATHESALVFTGVGENCWHADEHGRPWLMLFMDRGAPIWNNQGDVLYLRRADVGSSSAASRSMTRPVIRTDTEMGE